VCGLAVEPLLIELENLPSGFSGVGHMALITSYSFDIQGMKGQVFDYVEDIMQTTFSLPAFICSTAWKYISSCAFGPNGTNATTHKWPCQRNVQNSDSPDTPCHTKDEV
jgi:hypothetical protein